mgnify:CR=1 FL=1
MLSVITLTLLVLRISTTSSASTGHLDIPVDPGHTIPLLDIIPLDPGHTIPVDPGHTIPTPFPITHIGEFLGDPSNQELLATIFEKFAS